jgi:hypothetical protein
METCFHLAAKGGHASILSALLKDASSETLEAAKKLDKV